MTSLNNSPGSVLPRRSPIGRPSPSCALASPTWLPVQGGARGAASPSPPPHTAPSQGRVDVQSRQDVVRVALRLRGGRGDPFFVFADLMIMRVEGVRGTVGPACLRAALMRSWMSP